MRMEVFFGDFKSMAFGMSRETIEGGGFVVQILVALYMFVVFIVVLCIHLNSWRMTNKLGFMMFGLYLIFLAQDLARAL